MRALLIAAAAAFLVAGCAGTPSSQPPAATSSPAAPAAASAAAPSAPANPDETACQKFSRIAGRLLGMLSATVADPASVGATPDEARTLRHDGQLMSSWSKTATDTFNGQMVPLQLDLFNAGIGITVLGAGHGDPSAASHAQTAVSMVGSVTSDCSKILG